MNSSSTPQTNTGREYPVMAKRRETLSRGPSLCTAASVPSQRPTATIDPNAYKPNSSVAGKNVLIACSCQGVRVAMEKRVGSQQRAEFRTQCAGGGIDLGV